MWKDWLIILLPCLPCCGLADAQEAEFTIMEVVGAGNWRRETPRPYVGGLRVRFCGGRGFIGKG